MARVKVGMMAGRGRSDREERTFEAFFRSEYVGLSALAAALSGNREDGRDLAHEALTRAYKEWDDVALMERPGAWVRRVVVNLARDHARHREVRRRRLPVLASRVAADAAVEPMPFDGEFWAAVGALPERQRTAIALFYVGDQSVEQVAEVMRVSAGSVKATLHQARTRLRTLLRTEDAR